MVYEDFSTTYMRIICNKRYSIGCTYIELGRLSKKWELTCSLARRRPPSQTLSTFQE